MKLLLDENIPLALHRVLQSAGHDSEHIIELGRRGMPDSWIVNRLRREELLFLTQDVEFLDLEGELRSRVLVSRIDQSRPIADRVVAWIDAVHRLLALDDPPRISELTNEGELLPVDQV